MGFIPLWFCGKVPFRESIIIISCLLMVNLITDDATKPHILQGQVVVIPIICPKSSFQVSVVIGDKSASFPNFCTITKSFIKFLKPSLNPPWCVGGPIFHAIRNTSEGRRFVVRFVVLMPERTKYLVIAHHVTTTLTAH